MAAAKLDWASLEREYVTTQITGREMAKREHVSNSTISTHAKREGWEEKRQAYLVDVDKRYLKISAESRARQLSRLADQSVTVLEMALTRLAIQLAGDEQTGVAPMEVPIKEGLEVIRQIQTLRGLPSNITEERQVVGHLADPRFLEAIGELARANLRPEPVDVTPPRALPDPVERSA